MSWKALPESISESRMAGCSLTGALSVVSFIPGAVAVVHAPQGCVHQTFSMLHAMMQDTEAAVMPEILVSGISDKEVIFGGEECLAAALDRAAEKNPDLIVVLTSCVPETIGDDVAAVCAEHAAADRIVYVPTSGFLGGSAKDGENAALTALGERAPLQDAVFGTVAIVGEKNLESEADENYAEVERLLLRLGLRVTVRFCRNADANSLLGVGSASCFVLRDDRAAAAGAALARRFDRPLVAEFPRGLSGCVRFLRETGAACGISEEAVTAAVTAEEMFQDAMLRKFAELRGKRVRFGVEPFAGTLAVAREAAGRVGMCEDPDGCLIRLPFYLPVGTAGVQKMLFVWRRTVRNG